MLYDVYHLGFLQAGQYLSIKVNSVASLLFIDDNNLAKYKTHQLDYIAYNVLQLTFQASYEIPYTGMWNLVLEIGDIPALTRAEITLANIL